MAKRISSSKPQPLPSPPAQKSLRLIVPDHDDWYAFMAEVIIRAYWEWVAQGDRRSRFEQRDPTVPRHRKWAEWREDILRVARLSWTELGGSEVKSGRLSMFDRCRETYLQALNVALRDGRVQFFKGEREPEVEGRPITQGMIVRLMGEADPDLEKQVRRKYARMIKLISAHRSNDWNTLPNPSDQAFMKKYVPADVQRELDRICTSSRRPA